MSELCDITLRIPKGFKYADFDVKALKKGLRKEGGEIAKEARKLVSKKDVSAPGENPGRDTGTLRKSIKNKVSKSGFTATIKPWKIPAMGEHFYPAYVYYGHRGPKSRTAKDERTHRKTTGEKVAQPRANFMVEATKRVGEAKIETSIAKLMDDALASKEIKL